MKYRVKFDISWHDYGQFKVQKKILFFWKTIMIYDAKVYGDHNARVMAIKYCNRLNNTI